MKAYRLSIANDDEGHAVIVFANNTPEAKKQVYGTYLGDELEQWIDLRCRRASHYDGMENAGDAQLALKQWHDGWGFNDGDFPNPDEATDAEFLAWYEKEFGARL